MTIDRVALNEILAHAREAAPNECCGVLVGGRARILLAVRARNLETSPTRFLVDPADHIAARRQARAHGLEVVGFYHSHPRTPAVPSAHDLAEAMYDDAIHLIAGWRGGALEVRAYWFTNGIAEEESLLAE